MSENKTFGEFFDTIYEPHTTGAIWMDEWTALVSPEAWTAIKASEIKESLVTNFAEDMVYLFQSRMAGICTEGLYETIHKDGHEFLTRVSTVATFFGFDVSAICGAPATLSEAVFMAKKNEQA